MILLPLFTFIGHRSKRTLEAGYHSRLLEISEKICQLEKEKQDLSFCMDDLKDPQKETSYILEKIFYEQSQIFRAFHELYLCCSKEMTESYKRRLQADLTENSQMTSVSLKKVVNEIKKTFLQKIRTQNLTFTLKGKDIPIKMQRESSVYFILYFIGLWTSKKKIRQI